MGDVVANQNLAKQMENVIQHDPDLLFIGGDIGYDNGFLECYCIMDRTLSILETGAMKPNGVMIPIATAVGNHDLGLEGFAS